MSTVSKNLIKKNNNMHHFPNLYLQLLNGESGLTAFYERIVAMLFECVTAAQLDKIKVLCLKYLSRCFASIKTQKSIRYWQKTVSN